MFWLVAVPSLVGATLRIPYTFAVAIFGGRNWTIVSALLLLIPVGGMFWAVRRPDTSFAVMLFVAALAGAAQAVRITGIAAPAVIVLGEVAGLDLGVEGAR